MKYKIILGLCRNKVADKVFTIHAVVPKNSKAYRLSKTLPRALDIPPVPELVDLKRLKLIIDIFPILGAATDIANALFLEITGK